MFAWQIPHFMAIAWMYRDDYAKGGYMVLPVVDPSGRWTSLTIALWTIALIPATLMPAKVMPDRLGTFYLVVAGLAGAGFIVLAVRLILSRTRNDAKALFFGSIIHLPLLWWRWWLRRWCGALAAWTANYFVGTHPHFDVFRLGREVVLGHADSDFHTFADEETVVDQFANDLVRVLDGVARDGGDDLATLEACVAGRRPSGGCGRQCLASPLSVKPRP